jgi:hypothetical protein
MGDIHYNPHIDNSLSGMKKKALGWAFGKKKKPNAEEQPKRADDVHIAIY